MDIKNNRNLTNFMNQLDIKEKDIEEKFILGSGSGGQKIQKTSSCVEIKHTPTGIVIKCQRTRSREANRFWARWKLCEQIKKNREQVKEEKKEKLRLIKISKKTLSKSSKKKMLEEKLRLSKKKSMRKTPSLSDD